MMKETLKIFSEAHEAVKTIIKEMSKVIIGQTETIEHVLMCIFAGGHILLESAPGLAKTLMAETLSKVLRTDSKRIQLTPDLTPQDITGFEMPVFGTQLWVTRKGTIFTTICIADEINRAAEKTQAGFMEPMQERKVTIGLEDLPLDQLFTLIGTRNPIETGGTFAIAEAILDRFLVNAIIDYPSLADEKKIAVGTEDLSKIDIRAVCGKEDILPVRDFVLTPGYIEENHVMVDYIARIIDTSRPQHTHLHLSQKDTSYYRSMVSLSLASPRATKAYMRAVLVFSHIILGDKMILPEHVKTLAKSILRHRLILQSEAEYSGLTTDEIIEWLLNRVPIYRSE
ncbi:MAG: magnesium chelatase [Candidatus Tagabacteria bacterium CG_4_8_14_3_um_filter_41_8]|uniref:Magnesium chelatase n=1 Tax=Candidatus Tagabacteria bacterium CG_4_8_14_3_um_filter_41_8 TaxID=1975018 RepID=A0A2M8G8D7_9BACT|nr:MAG: magnesium chelatase [Candidatus Tagabacteria bacterium CG_4_8_14_3_um_filter_41_8]